MSSLIQALRFIAYQQPQSIALQDGRQALTWAALIHEIDRLTELLLPYQGKVIALYADNSIDWICVDLAAMQANIILLPVPAFFSTSQQAHIFNQTSAYAVIEPKSWTGFNRYKPRQGLSFDLTATLRFTALTCHEQCAIPEGTAKITFTSGSTGTPKGVCLSQANQLDVAEALIKRTGLTQVEHLCVLPLTTLLENIAGVYAPLLTGGQVMIRSSTELGFNGNTAFDVTQFTDLVSTVKPQSMIFLPELLSAVLSAVKQGWTVPETVQFIAVGGSRVASQLIHQARQIGLPVYEGYGLSECSSVVSLNCRHNGMDGSVGQPLNHVHVLIRNQQIIVKGNAFLGYVNEPESWYPDEVETGDLGQIDSEGYLHIFGRQKNLIISSYGRNINPEWIESELRSHPMIRHAIVLGESKPYCSALIELRVKETPSAEVDSWIHYVNQYLPEYAQIRQWQLIHGELSADDATLTANGRPRREVIMQRYSQQIEALYKEHA